MKTKHKRSWRTELDSKKLEMQECLERMKGELSGQLLSAFPVVEGSTDQDCRQVIQRKRGESNVCRNEGGMP